MKEDRYEVAVMAMLEILNYRKKIDEQYAKIQKNLTLTEIKRNVIDLPMAKKALQALLKNPKIKLKKSEYVGNSLTYENVDVNLHNLSSTKQRTEPAPELLKRVISEIGMKNILNY